jgi:hypothetical protein
LWVKINTEGVYNWGIAPDPKVFEGIKVISEMLVIWYGEGCEEERVAPPLRHFVDHPTGYPLAGCSSAEPASVSPVDFQIVV